MEVKPKIETIEDKIKLLEKTLGHINIDTKIIEEIDFKLTPDGIPTIETQLQILKQEEDKRKEYEQLIKEKIEKRDMLQRVKCLALHKMNKSIMTNTLSLSTKDRKKLQNLMWEYNDMDPSIIIEEFNIMCNDTIFNPEENFDYTKAPIYDYADILRRKNEKTT